MLNNEEMDYGIIVYPYTIDYFTDTKMIVNEKYVYNN